MPARLKIDSSAQTERGREKLFSYRPFMGKFALTFSGVIGKHAPLHLRPCSALPVVTVNHQMWNSGISSGGIHIKEMGLFWISGTLKNLWSNCFQFRIISGWISNLSHKGKMFTQMENGQNTLTWILISTFRQQISWKCKDFESFWNLRPPSEN